MATIDFSAEFGGRDAAGVILPHFKALKSVAKTVLLEPFPYPKLAFIFRVDGEVYEYGLSGVGNLDIDSNGQYLSVDVGITLEDRMDVKSKIQKALQDGQNLIASLLTDNDEFDEGALRNLLDQLCAEYAKLI